MGSFLVFLLVILGTKYLALVYESAALQLVFWMELVYFAVSFLWLLYRRFTVQVRLEVPVGISEPGKENLVRLVVRNHSPVPIRRLKVRVMIKDGAGSKRKRSWLKVASVAAGETGLVHGISFPEAGNYTLWLRKVRIYDGTGLLYCTVRGKSSAAVQVIPEIHEVAVRLTAATRNFYGEADVYDQHSPGHDNSEIFQIREYRKGDRLQNVHWKLTAKQEELMVKEHSLPKACPVVLFLAYTPKKGKKQQRRLAAYLEAVVSLSFSVMEAGCSHYVAWFDDAEQDVKRLRVEDEESLFYFIGVLMRLAWVAPKEDIIRRYRDKFRQEPYVWGLSLDEDLVLKKEDEVLVTLSEEHPGTALGQIELLL